MELQDQFQDGVARLAGFASVDSAWLHRGGKGEDVEEKDVEAEEGWLWWWRRTRSEEDAEDDWC